MVRVELDDLATSCIQPFSCDSRNTDDVLALGRRCGSGKRGGWETPVLGFEKVVGDDFPAVVADDGTSTTWRGAGGATDRGAGLEWRPGASGKWRGGGIGVVGEVLGPFVVVAERHLEIEGIWIEK